jgi:hypothetical protein
VRRLSKSAPQKTCIHSHGLCILHCCSADLSREEMCLSQFQKSAWPNIFTSRISRLCPIPQEHRYQSTTATISCLCHHLWLGLRARLAICASSPPRTSIYGLLIPQSRLSLLLYSPRPKAKFPQPPRAGTELISGVCFAPRRFAVARLRLRRHQLNRALRTHCCTSRTTSSLNLLLLFRLFNIPLLSPKFQDFALHQRIFHLRRFSPTAVWPSMIP